ncbi:unnamed protein product [Rhizophagus irregularis]|nr:unnamed protein product [Rhizophagus irregularis]
MALTDITKSDEGKYGQKNHFLWIKNPDALIYKDTFHKGKKHLCNRCFQSFPSSKSLTNHQEWCFGLGESPQRVELPVKDFEADNRKCNENYGGNMHKIMEQKANSFCYMVHWIETDETWGPFLYRGPNATEEFVCRLDKELRRINDVLEVKVERIVTEEAKKEFTEALQIEAWKTPIPVVFHNFCGYDFHLVCESVGRSIGAHQIKVIAETFERYKSMKETELPSIHDFHSTLGGKITQDNYKHAQKVWKEFGCKNLGEYHDLYLKTDVLLLADVWTKFQQTAMHHYGLDPSHYVSAPALSWDGMLKMTGVKIELFTDMTMHDFTEKAKRGGIAMAGHRFLKANNPKMGDSFNPSKPTTWISYVDANNLYGWAMSQYLPIGNYRWEASPEYFKQNPDKQKQILNVILNTKPDAARGYFLNIKAHFPLKTHDYLQDLPPAVDSIAVKKDRLSPYITKLVDNLDGGRFPETEKLVPHLGKHEDYVIHYQELQYYIKLGMVVDEITQVLSF